MSLHRLLRLPARLFSHLLLDQSYQAYYSAEEWDRKYGKEHYDLNVPMEDGRYGALMMLLQRYDRGGPILDAGCGDGLLQERYRPFSASLLVGIDYSAVAIDAARRRQVSNAEFATADFATFRAERPYAVIVFNETLYYIENYLDVLETFERSLKADGVIIVSMFDTLVTKRIWKRLSKRYPVVQGIRIKDHASGRSWTMKVFAKAGQ